MPLNEYPVLFFSQGARLAGRILRNTDDVTVRQPGVVLTGSWLTVKEQMPLTYARRLANLGYTCLVFDFAGFGESAGEPRQAEIPTRKMADIDAAARFLSTFSFVNPGGTAHLAVCASAQYTLAASAQYTLAAVAQGAPIRSFVSVAGWYHDAASVAPFYGDAEGAGRRISAATAAVEEYQRTGEVATVPAYDPADENAAMFFEVPYYGSAERGAVPTWKNRMAVMSWLYWLTFDGMKAAGQVSVPTLLVHGDGCVLPDNARAVYAALKGEKTQVWASEGTQTDFYDLPPSVDQAVAAAHDHLRRTMQP